MCVCVWKFVLTVLFFAFVMGCGSNLEKQRKKSTLLSMMFYMSDGRDVSDDELDALTSSLTQHQAEAVKRRVNTLSTTMRKKKGANKMHVKDIFPTPDNSSPVCSTPLCLFVYFLSCPFEPH